MSTALAEKVQKAAERQEAGKDNPNVYQLVERLKPEMARALPSQIDPERFTRIALTTIRLNPKLLACNPQSLLGALMTSAQLGLEPGTPLGHAYLVPYGKEVTFIVGYRGYLDLARRSGLIATIYAHVVREGDEFSYQLGLHPDITHIPGPNDDGKITHVYAVARFRDGSDPQHVVLTKAKVDTYRARSKAKDSGPWVDSYEAMALKTAVRRLATWLPLSPEMAMAQAVDDQVINHGTNLADLAAMPSIELSTGEITDGAESEHDQAQGEEGAQAEAPNEKSGSAAPSSSEPAGDNAGITMPTDEELAAFEAEKAAKRSK